MDPEEDAEILANMLAWLSSVAMIFGGVVPYIPQYRTIKSTGNAEGFSLYVCLALLVANVLRILFWFGHPFEFPLLLQSIIMILAMFVMIHLCVRVRSSTQIIRSNDRIFTDLDRAYFWKWTDFQSYVECILVFVLCGCVLMYLCLDIPAFVHTVGFVAVFVEAMLGMPQLVRNHRKKSTEGMSTNMVLMWTSGDIFKTFYYVLRAAPMQFWICSTLQVLVDIYILLQVFLYRYNKSV